MGPPPRWRVFPALALGTVMATLDISVVGLVLPVLARDLGAPLTLLSWVVLAYVLALTGLLLAFGRLADRLGRRRVYATGIVVFVTGSILCAASGAAPWLIAARAFQGIGAAMMSANSSALLVAAFPDEERGRALGAFGAAVGVGLAFGPALGGWIVSALSWHWIFLINVPIGAIALFLLLSRVPADAPAPPDPAAAPGAAHSLLWSLGLVLLMLALSLGPDRGWTTPVIPIAAAAGAIALALFGAIERRTDRPLLPWRHLRGPLGAAVLLTLAGQALSMAVAFLLPLQLEEVLGLDPAHAGRWLAIAPVAALFGAPLAGRLADRFGTRLLSVLGLLLAAAGVLLLSRLGVESRLLAPGAALFGVGLGLFTVPNASAVMGAVPPELLASASGLQATARNLGIAAGTAAASAGVATLYSRAMHVPLLGAARLDAAHATELARALGTTFAALSALGVAAALAAWFAPRTKTRPGMA